jgi:hypothetical protein
MPGSPAPLSNWYGISVTPYLFKHSAKRPKRKIDGIWRRLRIPKWRATVDESGHYSFAVAL